MNPRLLDLLKNPELLASTDLDVLEKEIKAKPYMQGLRALFLLGTHRFNKENYHRELSTTAAYTTDKKILYQLINGKNFETEITRDFEDTETVNPPVEKVEEQHILNEVKEPESENLPEIPQEQAFNPYSFITTSTVPIVQDITTEISVTDDKTVEKEVHKEEEKPVITTEEISSSKNSVEEINEIQETVNIQTEEHQEEVIVDSEINENSETELAEVIDDAQLSFHGLQEFMPEVKISAKETADHSFVPEQPTVNRHEDEMKRLIAEVEEKMKNRKATPKAEPEEIPQNSEISFAETQSFEPVKTSEKLEENIQPPVEAKEEEIQKKEVEEPEEVKEVIKTEWKPMNLHNSVPDSLLENEKTEEKKEPAADMSSEPINTKEKEQKEEEIPVMNVSFFAPTISSITENTEKTEEKLQPEEKEGSNIPAFINTWQSWLKIDRNEPKNTGEEPAEKSKEEVKAKAIEKFIENEPKISQLKEESSYVVKEKKGDISHLMTETLAKLYTEQKLYVKAIKAYETLIQKHPEKQEYFNQKIQEVKDLRSNPQ